jgi:hypothetical protein
MSRNKNNLTARQQLFLNELILGKQFNDILSEYHIRPATLMRWTTDQNFIDQWNLCNKVLALRSGSETPGAAIRLAQETRPAATSTQAPPADSASPSAPAPPTAPPSLPPEDVERELIRARHGDEAARGFDRLVQIRKQNERAATPPPPTTQPTPTDSPPVSGVPEGPLIAPPTQPDPQFAPSEVRT